MLTDTSPVSERDASESHSQEAEPTETDATQASPRAIQEVLAAGERETFSIDDLVEADDEDVDETDPAVTQPALRTTVFLSSGSDRPTEEGGDAEQENTTPEAPTQASSDGGSEVPPSSNSLGDESDEGDDKTGDVASEQENTAEQAPEPDFREALQRAAENAVYIGEIRRTGKNRGASDTHNEADAETLDPVVALPDEALISLSEGEAPNVVSVATPAEYKALVSQSMELLPSGQDDSWKAAEAEDVFKHEMEHAQAIQTINPPSGAPPIEVAYSLRVNRGLLDGEEILIIEPTVQPWGVMRKIDLAQIIAAPEDLSAKDSQYLQTLGYSSPEDVAEKAAALKEKYVQPQETHTALSQGLLAQVENQQGAYFFGNIGGEEVSLAGSSMRPLQPGLTASEQQAALLRQEQENVSATFQCLPGETDSEGNTVESYKYFSAMPNELDSERHADQLAAFFGVEPDVYYNEIDTIHDATGRTATVEELRTKFHREKMSITSPITFVITSYTDGTRYTEVLVETEGQARHHQRLKALEKVLTP